MHVIVWRGKKNKEEELQQKWLLEQHQKILKTKY